MKRTVQKGLRSATHSSQIDFPSKIIEKMSQIIETALRDDQKLDEKLIFVLNHAYKVAQFRLIKEYNSEKDKLLREISDNEEEGLKVGFSIEEIIGINFYILKKDQAGEVEILFQGLARIKAKAESQSQ